MRMASVSEGGGTLTAWKRRSSDRSFSMDLRYSLGVVAPMHWISPRDSAGFRILAASSEPSAAPAPTSVCSSSIKMMAFWFSISSFMMVLRRSSNWPRYLVPATIKDRSSARIRLSERKEGTSPSANALGQAFHDCRLPDAWLADQNRVVLGAAAQDLDHAVQLLIPPAHTTET